MVFIKIHVTFRWCIAQYKNADGRFQIQLSHHSRWKWIFKSHPTIEVLPFWNFVACEISIFGDPFVESPLEPFISPSIIEKSDDHFRLCFLVLWIFRLVSWNFRHNFRISSIIYEAYDMWHIMVIIWFCDRKRKRHKNIIDIQSWTSSVLDWALNAHGG